MHTALVLFGCISPDMCIAYSFGFVFFGSLYIQVMQGFIHDDQEDLINKHVMMIRVTDNYISSNLGLLQKSMVAWMYVWIWS